MTNLELEEESVQMMLRFITEFGGGVLIVRQLVAEEGEFVLRRSGGYRDFESASQPSSTL